MLRPLTVLSALLIATFAAPLTAQATGGSDWIFDVSGDSRNCGDIVMPAIARGVHADHASFYWHLGDFRAIYDFDQDILGGLPAGKHLTISAYQATAWDDFLAQQIQPFAPTPVFLLRGNHEAIPPMTHDGYLTQFADWLETPVLQQQRLADDPGAHKLQIYYHWREHGIDFVSLDNADDQQLDAKQMKWFQGVMSRAEADPGVRTIVVGMHDALPDSISFSHGMNDWPLGESTGRAVYAALLEAQNQAHKHVYILASHSHFYAANIYNTPYWKAHGGVLPGWIVGTAGAVRYKLPKEKDEATDAKTHVYGYLRATAHADGQIDFRFVQLSENDLKEAAGSSYPREVIHECYAGNAEAGAN